MRTAICTRCGKPFIDLHRTSNVDLCRRCSQSINHRKPGKKNEYQTCEKCQRQFIRKLNFAGGYHTICKPCRKNNKLKIRQRLKQIRPIVVEQRLLSVGVIPMRITPWDGVNEDK